VAVIYYLMRSNRPSAQFGLAASGFVTRLVLFLVVSVLSGVLVAGLVLPVLGSAGLVARNSADGFEDLPAELDIPALPERSRILASDGTLIANFYYENRVSVPLAEVSPLMRQAVVAIEDSRFYEHGGIDLRGTVRAFVNNQSGDSTQGGSTLTQQYVKQVLLERAQNIEDPKLRLAEEKAATEQSYSRKLKELRYAVALEEKYSKQQILERYLNIAYFGAGAYGVEAASRHYFSKSADALTLPQAALLAGIVQQPSAFDPIRHPDAALTRRNIVLARMAQVGLASQADVTAATATKLGLKVPKNIGNGCNESKIPFFCDFVLKTILNDPTFGATRADRTRLLLRGGLTITTTVDRKVQAAAQKAVMNYVHPKDKVASAVVSVQPRTGNIKAMAVSRGYGDKKGEIKFNPATDRAYGGSIGFQAGSTFKVFVAAAALEKGIPFSYPIMSPYRKEIGPVQTCNGPDNTQWDPTNESSSENGTYTLQTGIADSVNTYFAQLEQKVGVCRPAQIARALGVRTADDKALAQVKSFTLGTNLVSPLSMAEAYATFAARGEHCNAIAISGVVDSAGKSLPVPSADCKQAIEQKVADGMNQLLQGVMKFGTGERAALNRVSAGKTGTTDSRYNVWFVGYVPQLATAVWAGNPSPPRGGYPLVNRRIGGRYYGNVCGGCLPGPIWQQTMNNALEGVPVKAFATAPSDVVNGKPKPVPGVSGMSADQAKSVLRAAGFVPIVAKHRVFVDAKKGTVAYTSPGSGQDAYLGQTVTIYISGGSFTGPPPGGGGGGGDGPGPGGDGPGKPPSCPPICNGTG
jgi:membrane peptidoglycan carboxypeptidase